MWFRPAGQAPAHEQYARRTAGVTTSESVADQRVELRIQVAEPQAALDANHQRAAEEATKVERGRKSPGMKKMTSRLGMRTMGASGTMGADDSGSEGLNPAPLRPMRGMERIGKANRMRPGPALPGTPGASHIYHVVSTGFFLDHPQHITLTREQQATLDQLKANSLLETATSQRRIDEAEQQLWQLTGSDQADASEIMVTKRKNGSGTGSRGHNGEDPEVTAFVCHAGDASEVGLGGTFSGWKPTPMHKVPAGRWEVRLPLPPGRYEFKFLVDGEWCCEPGCDGGNMDCPNCVHNAHGTMNRVIEVT